ncbi:uncharacterized protein DNG_09709 [Cephalotrichum gorgonifer]|uniref:Uncharacterized protein n=1 Tax=Cephalotrichum gorgonifer TaxID=2041049 RepID=A0AAE8N8R1_9PEZI|nr:uncharacterized protein DNG_09709 [Cephalotrichum gorgonifer]
MSGNKDINNLANQGEFHARVPPSHPLTTKGHAPGVKLGNDAYPEFHAQAYPAGTAPPEHSFTPKASGGQWGADVDTTDTLPGATSADVDKGIGHPISEQQS